MSNKIAVVDVDGTLVPESHRLRAQAEAIAPVFGNDLQEIVYRFFEVNDWVAKNNPERKNDVSYYMELLAEKYELRLSPEEITSLATNWTHSYVDSNQEIMAFPHADRFLQTLKARGFKIIVASGNSRESREHILQKTNLAQYIDGLLAAKETGFQKQQAEFWDVLKGRFPELKTADSVVMIGNQLNDDALYPSRFGWKVFLVHWPGELDKVRCGTDSAISREHIKTASESLTMEASSLIDFLVHPGLQ